MMSYFLISGTKHPSHKLKKRFIRCTVCGGFRLRELAPRWAAQQGRNGETAHTWQEEAERGKRAEAQHHPPGHTTVATSSQQALPPTTIPGSAPTRPHPRPHLLPKALYESLQLQGHLGTNVTNSIPSRILFCDLRF